MTDIVEYIYEKLDRAVGCILELLMGYGYKLRTVQLRVPDIRRAVGVSRARHFPPTGPPCNLY